MLELVQSWGRGRGVRTEAVGEWLGRRKRREEVSEASNMLEREPVVAGRRGELVAQLLVRREPWLGVAGRLGEDQSLVAGGRGLEEHWREMFGSGKSQLLAIFL